MTSRTTNLLLLSLVALALGPAALRAADNELTAAEKAEGWTLLFNGRDLTGFRADPKRGYNKWKVEDGAITLTPAHPKVDPSFTPWPLFTEQPFTDYALKIDFHTGSNPETGHSSVILRASDPNNIRAQPAIELNVFGPARTLGHFATGAFRYQLQAPTKLAMKRAGEWNTFEITVRGGSVRVLLNGEPVNELDLDQWDTPGKRPDGSNHPLPVALKDLPRTGPIGLRDDYGIPVWYKNIKLKPLE